MSGAGASGAVTFQTLRAKLIQERKQQQQTTNPDSIRPANGNDDSDQQQQQLSIVTATANIPSSFDLHSYAIHTPNNIPGLFLIPNFVTDMEAKHLQRHIQRHDFTTLHYRRVQCWGGDPMPMTTRPALPSWLNPLTTALESLSIVPFHINHVLINEYQPEPESCILPHTDGPMYDPYTVCLSIGEGCADFIFTPRRRSSPHDMTTPHAPPPLATITLPPRSLVIFTGSWYTDALHAIENVRDGVRWSLTLRRIK